MATETDTTMAETEMVMATDTTMAETEDGDGDGHDHGDWPTFV